MPGCSFSFAEARSLGNGPSERERERKREGQRVVSRLDFPAATSRKRDDNDDCARGPSPLCGHRGRRDTYIYIYTYIYTYIQQPAHDHRHHYHHQPPCVSLSAHCVPPVYISFPSCVYTPCVRLLCLCVSLRPSVGACISRVRTIMLAADGFGDRRRRGR